MKLENNYIFLSRKDKKTDPIIKYIKDSFDIKEMATPAYKNLDQFTYKHNLKKIEISIVFELITMPDKTFLKITAENKYKTKCVTALEEVEQQLLNTKKLNDTHIVVISNSATSEYYCNKIYPKLNEFERKLRQLMFNIYIYHLGKEYLKITTDQQLKNIIKKNTRTNSKNIKTKEIDRIQNAFYELTYDEIKQFLFSARWCELNEKKKNEFLNSNPDLTQLTDEELRRYIISLQPQSDWDRFFAQNILSNEDIPSLYNIVHRLRNSVAHCKLFSKDDYKNCLTITNILIKNIDEALKITEEKDFMERNISYLDQSFQINLKGIGSALKQLSKAIAPMAELSQRANENIARTIILPLVHYMQSISGSVADNSPIAKDKLADSDEKVDDDKRDD